MKIINSFSPNYSKKSRKISKINFVIIHYTGMQSTRVSLSKLCNPKNKVSAHYVIDRKGGIFNLVATNKIAWHAGKSRWKNKKNLNSESIGIELQNRGHGSNYENYGTKQIKSLIYICKKLKGKYKINQGNFLGHSDIAPLRKIDPGEKFPWEELSKFGLGTWYKNEDLRRFKIPKKNLEKIFFQNLEKIGYRYFFGNSSKKVKKLLIKAFKRRYNQKIINSQIDEKTFKISCFLAKKG